MHKIIVGSFVNLKTLNPIITIVANMLHLIILITDIIICYITDKNFIYYSSDRVGLSRAVVFNLLYWLLTLKFI